MTGLNGAGRSDLPGPSVQPCPLADGVSPSAVSRLCCRRDLKPHLAETCELTQDPECGRKSQDVIGLCLGPLEKAVLLCRHEQARGQALGHTQPALPLGVGPVRARARISIRHGTICLFAAMSYLEGKLTYRAGGNHTHPAWLRFLKQIDLDAREVFEIHLIAGNCRPHRHRKAQAWLARRQQFHMHFAPRSSLRPNLVERFLADVTADCIPAGSFTGVKELAEAIATYTAERNRNPRPYKWKASGERTSLGRRSEPARRLQMLIGIGCHLGFTLLGSRELQKGPSGQARRSLLRPARHRVRRQRFVGAPDRRAVPVQQTRHRHAFFCQNHFPQCQADIPPAPFVRKMLACDPLRRFLVGIGRMHRRSAY